MSLTIFKKMDETEVEAISGGYVDGPSQSGSGVTEYEWANVADGVRISCGGSTVSYTVTLYSPDGNESFSPGTTSGTTYNFPEKMVGKIEIDRSYSNGTVEVEPHALSVSSHKHGF